MQDILLEIFERILQKCGDVFLQKISIGRSQGRLVRGVDRVLYPAGLNKIEHPRQ